MTLAVTRPNGAIVRFTECGKWDVGSTGELTIYEPEVLSNVAVVVPRIRITYAAGAWASVHDTDLCEGRAQNIEEART